MSRSPTGGNRNRAGVLTRFAGPDRGSTWYRTGFLAWVLTLAAAPVAAAGPGRCPTPEPGAPDVGQEAPRAPEKDRPEPTYPWVPGRPCLGNDCGSRLVDLEFELEVPTEETETRLRALVRDRLYLSLDRAPGRRGASLMTARWHLAWTDADRADFATASYRAGRVRLAARATRFGTTGNARPSWVSPARSGTKAGWGTGAELAWRLSPDLELLFDVSDDEPDPLSDSAEALASRASGGGIGFAWQRGASFDLEGRLSRHRVRTQAGFVLDREDLGLAARLQRRRWYLAGDAGLESVEGRLRRRQARIGAALEHRVTTYLVAGAELRGWHDLDLGTVERAMGMRLVLHARPFRFARGGEAAEATTGLAREAYRLGFNERRRHDLEGRRLLRERLLLAAQASGSAELSRLSRELYRAQVAERNVEIAGLAWRLHADRIQGGRSWTVEGFVAVPWIGRTRPDGADRRRLRHPEAVDFLRLTVARTRRHISAGLTTEGTSARLALALHRELALTLDWEEPALAGVDLAFGAESSRRLSIGAVYRQGI